MDTQSVYSLQAIHTNYIRNSRAIAVLWCVFTICFAIINIIVFTQPWLASLPTNAQKEGYIGLFESCVYDTRTYEVLASSTVQTKIETKLLCEGTWTDFGTSVNPVATFFIGFSALNNLICIAIFLVLFLFVNPSVLFIICGVLQLISSVCMLVGCVVYPYNWHSSRISDICETSSAYNLGKCEIKWAYILAIIGIFDILCLAILAFVLAARQAPSLDFLNTVDPVLAKQQHAYINENASFDERDLDEEISRFNSLNRSRSRTDLKI